MFKNILEQIKIEYYYWKIRRILKQIEKEKNV